MSRRKGLKLLLEMAEKDFSKALAISQIMNPDVLDLARLIKAYRGGGAAARLAKDLIGRMKPEDRAELKKFRGDQASDLRELSEGFSY
jgi:hypothetical protein